MSLLGQLQFWTLKNSIFINDTDIGVFKVYDKHENIISSEHPYLEDKELYAVGRGITWIPKNKPFKLRDSLKDLEETLLNDKCVAIQWITGGVLQLFFNSGLLASLHIAPERTCVNKITLDRHLCGKLATDHIADMIRDENIMLICYSEAKLTYIYFSKKPKRLDKLSNPDIRFVTIDLDGPPARRFDRRLSLNSLKDSVLLWWSTRSNEVRPWMPTSSDRDRANLVVYALNNASMELLSYAQTDGDVVSANFSKVHSDQILTVEEHVSNSKKISVNICKYHVSRGRFLRTSQTTVPLQGHVVCCQWSNQEECLVIACSDMSIVLYNTVRQITRLTMALFVPVEVAWHPAGAIIFVASEKGNLQCFDIGLSCLNLQVTAEEFQPLKKLDISVYFKSPPLLLRLLWEGSEKANQLCLLFDKGPLAIFTLSLGVLSRGQITPFELVVQHLKEGLVDEAIGLLHSLNWITEAETCFKCMSHTVNFLLKKTLNHDREAQLEAALGSFYDTSHPLPDLIVEEYRQKMGHLARRFFHYLLRYERLEKAFLLAVDLGCRDLFMDLHNIAIIKKETKLADVALQRADQLDTQSMTSRSGDSESTEEEISELSEDDPQAQQLNVSDPPLMQFSPDNETSKRNASQEQSQQNGFQEQSVRPKVPLPSRQPPAPPSPSGPAPSLPVISTPFKIQDRAVPYDKTASFDRIELQSGTILNERPMYYDRAESHHSASAGLPHDTCRTLSFEGIESQSRTTGTNISHDRNKHPDTRRTVHQERIIPQNRPVLVSDNPVSLSRTLPQSVYINQTPFGSPISNAQNNMHFTPKRAPPPSFDSPPAIPPRRENLPSPSMVPTSYRLPVLNSPQERYRPIIPNPMNHRLNDNNNQNSTTHQRPYVHHSNDLLIHNSVIKYDHDDPTLLDDDDTENTRIHFEHFGVI